jgi:uncharacterized protein YydD (DUF2326 family)
VKLTSLYCNFEDMFPKINFNEGLNVVFGQVKDKKEKRRDSHNLGKTFLISVIDFCLLADIDKEHPFKSKHDLFKDFVFFLEVETNDGRYVTIKRGTNQATKISIGIANVKNRIYSTANSANWTYNDIAISKAKEALNSLLNLSAIAPFKFRKGLSYVMRRQNDYNDEFRTSKFIRSKDVDWKPYLVKILGFDETAFNKKYETEKQIEVLKSKLSHIENDAGSKSAEYDEIRGRTEIGRERIEVLRRETAEFDFKELEDYATKEMVNEVEVELRKLNERKYRAEAEIRDLNHSINSELDFDLGKIDKLFREANLAFEGQIRRNYEQLIEFNKRLSIARNERLKLQLISTTQELEILSSEINKSTLRRQKLAEILLDVETLEKFKILQSRLLEKEKEVFSLEEKLKRLDEVNIIEIEISSMQSEKMIDIGNINREIRNGNEFYSGIRKLFSDLVTSVLDTQAILSININIEGNLEPKIRTIDLERETNERDGTSYKKMLCACFDLAITSTHAKDSFYRYIYHDGIFEGLDNRKKINLLNRVREICENDNIQYILTVIDSDLPRDEVDNKLLFNDSEIILKLNDDGEKGRLFKMAKF